MKKDNLLRKAGLMFDEVASTTRDILIIARTIYRAKGPVPALWYLTGYRIKRLGRPLFDLYCLLDCRLHGKPVVYAIGDSHAKVFRGERPFVVRHVGAATAHNLGLENSTTNSNRKLFRMVRNIRPDDVLLLVFGEIDCRIHIYYQYKKRGGSQTVEDLVGETVSSYGLVLHRLREQGLKFAVLGVPPATRVRNEYRYPFYATPEVHSSISRKFNEALREFCEANGYPFIDVHSKCSDPEGFMLDEYAQDEIHLNPRIADFVKGELRAKVSPGIR